MELKEVLEQVDEFPFYYEDYSETYNYEDINEKGIPNVLPIINQRDEQKVIPFLPTPLPTIATESSVRPEDLEVRTLSETLITEADPLPLTTMKVETSTSVSSTTTATTTSTTVPTTIIGKWSV